MKNGTGPDSRPKVRILCVCKGNSDRSPLMAAVLEDILKRRSDGWAVDAVCESAGSYDVAAKGGPASKFAMVAARRLGLDLSNHNKRQVGPDTVARENYTHFVCADEEVAGYLIMQLGVDVNKVYNASIANPWPCQFQEQYDATAAAILGAMYIFVSRYFPSN